jgi:hypothetical protein
VLESAEGARHRLRRHRCLVEPAGPGGPILVVIDRDRGFGRYLPEILRAEGLNGFAVASPPQLDDALLDGYQVVLTADAGLDAPGLAALERAVRRGVGLVAIRPGGTLAALAGLAGPAEVQVEGRVRFDGIDRPLQFHGPADRWTSVDGEVLGELGHGASAAATWRRVGEGTVAALTYDLPQSVVLTRQGNPSWAGQNRDGDMLTRSNDLFFGGAAGDEQEDWVAPDLLDVPQADEHQRLLVRLLQHVSPQPLPRFWYLPGDRRAAIVMTGDDHAANGTASRFRSYAALDDPGAGSWDQVRGTSYVYPQTALSDEAAAAFAAAGFEISIHLSVGLKEWTPGSLARAYRRQLRSFRRRFPSLPAPTTHRLHAVVWSDWATQAEIERAHGIRLDTNYYFFPASWVAGRTGFFTGSGLPMRFATADGEVIDCYQAPTQLTDESDQVYPDTIEQSLDGILGVEGRVGILTANMHTDLGPSNGSDAIVAAARRRGVAVISARQLLEWLDAREASRIDPATRAGEVLSFEVTASDRADELHLLVPLPADVASIRSATCDGVELAIRHELLGGTTHARLPARTGRYQLVCGTETASLPAIPAEPARDLPRIELRGSRLSGGTGHGTFVSAARGGAIMLAPALRSEPMLDGADEGWDRARPPGRVLELDIDALGGRGFLGFRGEGADCAGFELADDTLAGLVVDGSSSRRIPVRASVAAETRRLRIEWNAGLVLLTAGGLVVGAVRASLPRPMTPVISADGCTVRSARLGPYAPTGSYELPIVDAGAEVGWGRAWLTAPAQDFVAAELDVRLGPTPGGSEGWSPWVRLDPARDRVDGRSRYAQCRLVLTTGAERWTPEVLGVTLEHE